MIFTTKNKELAIFGNTIDDIRDKINKLNQTRKNDGWLGENGALASLFSGKKLNNILSPEVLKQFDEFKEKFNSSSLSAEALAEQMENVDQRIIDYAKTCKNGEMTTEGFKASIDTMSFSAKAGKVALQALAMAGNMIAMWGITEVISAIHSCITASDRLQESAKDLGSQFSSTKSDIEGYKSKINDLYKAINDSSSSYEDTYNARQQLLTIQDEMIEKFGSEAEAVQLVTTAINGQTEALDSLTKQKWQETVNEFTNGSDKKLTERVGDSWANLWSGASNNFDRMIKEMENTEVNFRVIPRYDDEGTYEEFSNKLKENFGASITHTERDDVFTLSGDLDEIYDQLLNIQSLATNMGIDDSFLPDLSRQADETKKTLENYQEIYNQHILYDKIFDSDVYEKSFNDINNAYKEYQEVFASGNDDAIETAKQSFAEIVQGATEGISDQSVIDYFNSMYPDLQEVVGGWKFEVKFKTAIDDDADNFENEVEDAIGKFENSNSVLNFHSNTATQEQIDAYAQLNSIADEYNLTLEQLIAKLEQLGLISSNVKLDLRNKLSNGTQDLVIDDWIATLADEEASMANSTAFDEALKRQREGLNGAALSAENYNAALDEVKASQDGIGNETGISPLSISQTIDQLNTQLKPAFDSLQSAYQDIFTDDGKFALNSIDILSTCDTIKSKLDEMSDPEGLNLDVDYSAFEDFVRVLNNTESTEQDVENAFDSLATSITQAALTGAEDFETMKSALEDLGVVNNEMVAFQALASNTEMLEQALSEANASMDDFIVNTKDGSVKATEAGHAFLEEKVGAENCAEALNILAFHKELCNLQEMNTAGEVANLKTLAENAGYTGEVIQYLTEMEQIYQEIASGTLTPAQLGAKVGRAAILKSMIDGAASKVQYAPKVDWSGAVKDAGKAGKDSGKSFKDKLKEELSDLESVISGIMGRIDDQISSINEQKSAALESIDAQKEALEEAKDAAVEALEAERDARLEVIETQKEQLEEQIKLIDKQIKQKQDEIDAINEAAEARKRELDLQKAQYELERMQNQRTKLVYSSEKGMHYEADTSGIGDAKEAVDDAKRQIEIANIQKEIDLLEDQKDLLSEQITLLDEQADAVNKYYEEQISQTEKFYDQQLKNLEKQREETESYFESITKNLENQKSKFQELTEILEKAELSAKLKQLGIDEEALLNGSEEEFNKLKDAYMNIVFQLNEGNDEVLNKLRELSGYEGTAPTMLEESNTKLGTMNDELGNANTEVGNVNSSLTKTASTTSDVATNVSDVNTNIGETVGLVNNEKGAFDELKQTIDLIVEAINQKIQAIETGQSTVSSAVGSEMANFQLLINKILEVKEKLDAVNDTVATMDRQPIDNLTNAFQLLYDKLLLVSNLLGVSAEGEGAVNGISGAIQALNEISLEEGIIAQFTNLKTAIDSVTAAISGGGGESSEGEGSGSGSGSSGDKQGSKGGKGSQGKGESGGGGNSLTGAIESMGETAKEVIGEPDAEGDGTVIGEFGSMETAVNDVRDAIGTGDSEGGEGGKSGSGGKGESDDTLVGSIINLGDTTQEEMGESDGDGIIGKFNEFKGVIEEAANQVKSISEGLDEIDGKEVECSITVNVKMNGSIPAFASGTVLGNMQIESATYNAQYGKAFANGTIGLKHDEKNALRSEYGQPELTVYPNGTTELTTSPVMSDLPKGTVIYNEEETKKIMDNKSNPVGNAHADGTDDSIWTTLADGSKVRPLQPGDKMWDLYHAFDAYLKSIDGNLEKLVPNSLYEQNREWNKLADQISYANSVVNNNKNVQQPVIHGGINITCPGVTSKEVAQQVGVEVDRIFNGMHLEAEQRSRMR